jgi:hypothetical protein
MFMQEASHFLSHRHHSTFFMVLWNKSHADLENNILMTGSP